MESPATTFAQELFRHGSYILACGGGVVPEPRRAVGELSQRYSREELVRRAIEIVTMCYESALPEGTASVAAGVAYLLGDRSDLVRLIALCQQ